MPTARFHRYCRPAVPKKVAGSLLVAAFCIATLLPAICSTALAQESTVSAEKQASINQVVSDFFSASKVPGLSVAIVLNGQLAWSNGYGLADLENSVPATPATLFRLASISKPITATAILQLWQQGKIDLDAPVQKYCPAFPQKEFPI